MTIVSPEDLTRFRALVARRFGLDVPDYELAHLEAVLRQRLQAAQEDYSRYEARVEGGAREELVALAEALTVGETYFFRTPGHFEALRDEVLPERMEAHRSDRRLTLLSAGCASGEEAYTIAIVAQQRLAHERGWDVRIQGVDLNPAFLRKAQEACYSRWSLRGVPESAVRRYFRKEACGFRLAEPVRAMVSFEARNLLEADPAFWQPGAFDVIFCRNVLIYFAAETTRALVARFARALAPGGFLFLGPSDSLRGLSSDFHLRHTHGVFYYQRKTPAEATPPARPCRAPEVRLQGEDPWTDVIHRSTRRVRSLSESIEPAPVAAPKALDLALALFKEERFDEARQVLDAQPAPGEPDALILHAATLINQGLAERAEAECRELLARDEFNAGAHYLLALCREKAGDPASARRHDEVALYLDPDFAMAHLHLGLILKRAGQAEAAQREFAAALRRFPLEDPARILLYGGGFSRESLMALSRSLSLGGDA